MSSGSITASSTSFVVGFPKHEIVGYTDNPLEVNIPCVMLESFLLSQAEVSNVCMEGLVYDEECGCREELVNNNNNNNKI